MDLQHTKGIMQDILKAGRLGIPPPGPRRPGRACCFGVARMSYFLRNTAFGLMLPSPWLLLHALTAIEISIDLASLRISAALHNRTPLELIGTGWGAARPSLVGMACAVYGVGLTSSGQDGALLQAVLVSRFLIFSAALQLWILAGERGPSLAVPQLGLRHPLQFASRTKLHGAFRPPDSELAAPFGKPRDAPTFVRMPFSALLQTIGALLAHHGLLQDLLPL